VFAAPHVQQSCACGSTDVEMHHPDYDKPLEVIWMCRSCHLVHQQKHFAALS
jgi:hypothetical protein